MQEVQVQFLVGKLRSHMPHGTARKFKNEKTTTKKLWYRFCWDGLTRRLPAGGGIWRTRDQGRQRLWQLKSVGTSWCLEKWMGSREECRKKNHREHPQSFTMSACKNRAQQSSATLRNRNRLNLSPSFLSKSGWDPGSWINLTKANTGYVRQELLFIVYYVRLFS